MKKITNAEFTKHEWPDLGQKPMPAPPLLTEIVDLGGPPLLPEFVDAIYSAIVARMQHDGLLGKGLSPSELRSDPERSMSGHNKLCKYFTSHGLFSCTCQ